MHNSFGIPDAALIQPGRPESSVLLHRVSQRGAGQMPPLASGVRDERAIELLRRWISGL